MTQYTLKMFIKGDDELRQKYMEAINNHNNQVEQIYYNSGFDLFTPCSIEYHTLFNVKLDTQVVGAMFNDGIPSPYYLYPRSSISKTNLRLANSVGIIDSGYRGNLIAMFDVIGDTHFYTFSINKYDRLVQICAPNLAPFRVEIVDSLDDLGQTERGDGGFGSTGK